MQIVCFFSRYCGLRPKRRGSTPVAMSTSISTELSEDTSFPEAAMFALCYSLYSCSPHRIDPLRLSPRDWVLLLPSLPMIGHLHTSRILLLGCTDNSQGRTSTCWRRSLMGCTRLINPSDLIRKRMAQRVAARGHQPNLDFSRCFVLRV